MSSFRWGMIACPTPTNSQVTVWKLRQPLFSLHIRIVLLSALHSDALLGSAGIPLHFGLSLCNPWEQRWPPYIKWKGTSLAFIWGLLACYTPRIYREMKLFKDLHNPPSYYRSPNFLGQKSGGKRGLGGLIFWLVVQEASNFNPSRELLGTLRFSALFDIDSEKIPRIVIFRGPKYHILLIQE